MVLLIAQIRVGIEALDELFPLVVEISGNVEAAIGMGPGVFSVAVGIAAEAFGEQLRRLVGAHGDLARQGKSLGRDIIGGVLAVAPLGIEPYDMPLQMIQR